MQINSGVHHDVVMAQRGMGVALIEAVVNQQLPAVVMCHPSSNVNNRVLMNSKQRFEPDHNRAFSSRYASI